MGVFLRIGGEFLMIVSGIPLKYLEMTMTVLLVGRSGLHNAGRHAFGAGYGLPAVHHHGNRSGRRFSARRHARQLDQPRRRGAKPAWNGAFNPLVSPEMGVTYVLWQALNQLAVVLTWQTVIQRVLASRDARVARQVYIKTSFFFVGRFLIPAFWGMAALVALDASRDASKLASCHAHVSGHAAAHRSDRPW